MCVLRWIRIKTPIRGPTICNSPKSGRTVCAVRTKFFFCNRPLVSFLQFCWVMVMQLLPTFLHTVDVTGTLTGLGTSAQTVSGTTAHSSASTSSHSSTCSVRQVTVWFTHWSLQPSKQQRAELAQSRSGTPGTNIKKHFLHWPTEFVNCGLILCVILVYCLLCYLSNWSKTIILTSKDTIWSRRCKPIEPLPFAAIIGSKSKDVL